MDKRSCPSGRSAPLRPKRPALLCFALDHENGAQRDTELQSCDSANALFAAFANTKPQLSCKRATVRTRVSKKTAPVLSGYSRTRRKARKGPRRGRKTPAEKKRHYQLSPRKSCCRYANLKVKTGVPVAL